MIEIEEDKLLEWIKHLQDEDASGAWNKDDDIKFKQILQDHELRKEIVDLADIWDGKESIKYGKTLMRILSKLGIEDIPEFYSKENTDKFHEETLTIPQIEKYREQIRKDRQIVKRIEDRKLRAHTLVLSGYKEYEKEEKLLQKIIEGKE